jgi:hypothetical protein
MHQLKSQYKSEFLATPQLVRVDYAVGSNGFEPTLLVKGSTLLLKYIVLGARLQFHLVRLDDHLLYALRAFDDVSRPATLWSVVENETEVTALKGWASGESCPVFLFNELALNVAWSTLKAVFPRHVQDWISNAAQRKVDYTAVAERAHGLLEQAFQGTASSDELVSIELDVIESWRPLFNHLVTSHGGNSPIDLFSKDEGGHQEQLAVWLTDNLLPGGVHHSPQIPKGRGQRELTDVLLSHEYGAFLIESKALTIFNRETLPSRAKLTKDVSHHVDKAIRQLSGGIRRLKEEVLVTSLSRESVEVERTKPMHAIVLIPEFDLIEDREKYGVAFIADFMKATGGFIHLLDVAELLRVVQAAEILSCGSSRVTPLMAFDYYLMERAERTRDAGTLCIQVLLRTGN